MLRHRTRKHLPRYGAPPNGGTHLPAERLPIQPQPHSPHDSKNQILHAHNTPHSSPSPFKKS